MSKLRNIFAWAIFLLIALVLAVFGVNYLVPENKQEYFMVKAQFGMTEQQISTAENKPFVWQAGNDDISVLAYAGEFDNVPATVFYGFSNKALIVKIYEIAIYQPKQVAPVDDFLSWVKVSENVYGKPVFVRRAWDDDPELLTRLGGGNLASYRWEQEDMIIGLALYYPERDDFPPEAKMPTIEISYLQKGQDYWKQVYISRLAFYTQWNVPFW